MYEILCILVMALVSYIPRAAPMLIINRKIKNQFFISFLYYVPYAVLAALTFPSIFYCTSNVYVSIFGTVIAIILAYLEQEIYVVALGAVIAVYFGFNIF